MVDIDTDKIDKAVLALLQLTLHDGFRAWKGHDWDALGRLYRKGMICDPVGKTKSVVLTDEGWRRAGGCSGRCSGGLRHRGDDQATAASGGLRFQGKRSSSRVLR